MNMPGSLEVRASLRHAAVSTQGESSGSECCYMIREVSEYLTIPPWVAGHAMMYCHVFFATRDPETNDCLAVAIAALFLACKVPELTGSAVQTEGTDPLMADFDRGHLAVVVRTCLEWVAFHDHHRSNVNGRQQFKINVPRQERAMKERVLAAERAILMDLGYQFVEYPLHGDVYQRCQCVGASQELTQAAWNIASDSFISSVALNARCSDLAWAIIDTAARMVGQQDCLRAPTGAFVWEAEGLEHNVLDGISHSVQGLYMLGDQER